MFSRGVGMNFVKARKKKIGHVNLLSVLVCAVSVLAGNFVVAESKIETQKLVKPVLVDSVQLKRLVRDINELDVNTKAKSDKPNKVDIFEAEELYIVKVLDPYAGMNKVFSDVNVGVYRLIKTPANFYVNNPFLAPVRWVVAGGGNIISNLDELLVGTTSNLLTAKFADAGKSAGRSIFNIAFGLGGAVDTASILASETITDQYALENMDVADKLSNSLSFGLEIFKQPEVHSFDDVLREWGFGCGFYLVFPVIGPQTARKVTGTVAELPLRVDTYVAAGTVLRVASAIDDGLRGADKAKIVLDDIDLATEIGKEQFYNTLRLATLSTNKCIKDEEVQKFAKKENLIITDEIED
jgi:ABC-type transporter lipoprotein component MlaA